MEERPVHPIGIDVVKHTEVSRVPIVDVAINRCAEPACRKQISAKQKRESLWGCCKDCENERLGRQ